MKIYGVGVLHSPGTRRVVHDFADGPYETSNPVLLDYAKRKGFSIGKPLENALIKEPVKAKRKYTKKAKNGS